MTSDKASGMSKTGTQLEKHKNRMLLCEEKTHENTLFKNPIAKLFGANVGRHKSILNSIKCYTYFWVF